MPHVFVVADQFREGMTATSAESTNEALAWGKPVITSTDGALIDSLDPYYSCPILQALSEQEIYDWFVRHALIPVFAKKIVNDGEKWFDNNISFPD